MGFIHLKNLSVNTSLQVFYCIADMTDMIDRHKTALLSVVFNAVADWCFSKTAEEDTRESRAYYAETTEEAEALEEDSETS